MSRTALTSLTAAFTSIALFLGPQLAFGAPSSSTALAPYHVEIMPVLGISLPDQIWGPTGTLSAIGLRSSVFIPDSGAIEIGGLYQHDANNNKAYTGDISYRYELTTDSINAFFNLGFHYSKFSLVPGLDGSNRCLIANCLTDTGTYTGLVLGGGISIPLSPSVPLKLAGRFYNGPVLWLLLEAGIAFRF